MKTRSKVLAVAFLASWAMCPLGLCPDASAQASQDANVEWGKSANGLRCAISLSETNLRVGDQVVVSAKLQNVSDRPITIHYVPSYYDGKRLMITAAGGAPVRSYESGISEAWSRKPPFEVIRPGEAFPITIKGRIALEFAKASYLSPQKPDRPIIVVFGDVTHELIGPGEFTMSFRFACDDKTAAALAARHGVKSVWTGSVASGVVSFNVRTMRRDELDEVIEKLRSGTEGERAEAAQVIGANADRQAVPALMEVLASGGYSSARGAARALCGIGDSNIVPELVQIYVGADSDERRLAVLDVLRVVTPDYGDLLGEVVRSKVSSAVRGNAAYWLADASNSRKVNAVHVLLEAAKAPDPRVQCAAIDGLALLEDDLLRRMSVGGLLSVMESDPEGGVRSRAAQALGGIGGPSVVPALIRALKDPDPWVGSYAAHSLGRLAGPEAIKPLEDYAKAARRDSQVNAAKAAIEEIKQRARSR